MAGGIEFSAERFNELVLLLAERSAEDPLMSRVKLNKLLYYVDFEAYRRLGRSVTGATYIRGEHGPMAAELPRAEEALGQRGYLSWRREPAGPYVQKIPVADEPADPTLFSEPEHPIIEDALEALRTLGGKGAREWSHETSVGWSVTEEEGDTIPYHTSLISSDPIPKQDLQRARSFVRERGWVKEAS